MRAAARTKLDAVLRTLARPPSVFMDLAAHPSLTVNRRGTDIVSIEYRVVPGGVLHEVLLRREEALRVAEALRAQAL